MCLYFITWDSIPIKIRCNQVNFNHFVGMVVASRKLLIRIEKTHTGRGFVTMFGMKDKSKTKTQVDEYLLKWLKCITTSILLNFTFFPFLYGRVHKCATNFHKMFRLFHVLTMGVHWTISSALEIQSITANPRRLCNFRCEYEWQNPATDLRRRKNGSIETERKTKKTLLLYNNGSWIDMKWIIRFAWKYIFLHVHL